MPSMDMLETNREYYRQNASLYDSDEQPFVHQRAFVEQMVLRFMDCSPNRRILDLGAGTGSSTRVLVESFPAAEVVGIDVSPEMLAIASHKCPTASFDVFDGKRIPFKDKWFDGILVSSVLHHIDHYERALMEIMRVCGSSSWIVITQEPNPGVNRWVNRMRRVLGQKVPDILQRAEGYQFTEEGGIPPRNVVEALVPQGFSCELVYNNDALLDSLLRRHRVLYRLLKT